MFVSRNAFVDYMPLSTRVGDSAKAEDGSFEIIGEGSVLQRYRVDGMDRDITYTRALHTPTPFLAKERGSPVWQTVPLSYRDDIPITTSIP